eukprot:465915_1
MGATNTKVIVKKFVKKRNISKRNHSANVVFTIGRNAFNEFTLKDNKQYTKTLTKAGICSSNINIESIQSHYELTIYITQEGQIHHIAGNPTIASSLTLEYFKMNNIEIKSVFTNISGENAAIFWLTDNNQIFGNTKGVSLQIGVRTDTTADRSTPLFIDLCMYPGNIIDIKSGRLYSIALCSYSNYNNIIKYWARIEQYMSIPNDVMKVIIMFYSLNKLYSTGAARYGGHCDGKKIKHFWSEIKYFDKLNVRITKLATGYYHTLCLDSDGNVWCCGNNDYGQMGLGHYKTNATMSPKTVKYFVRYKIRIKGIKCGHSHNLALSYSNLVYSWGNNEHGQCGHGTIKNVNKPKLIELFKKKKHKMVNIQCGTWHSFACNDKNEYFLWGSNVYNECVTNEHNRKIIVFPHCINDVVKTQTKYKWIKSISLGKHNTKIIVSNSNMNKL